GVEPELSVEEGEVEVVAVVVVLGYPRLVGARVAEQPRLDEAPDGRQGMAIREHAAEVEGGEEIAREVEIAVHVGFADARLVHGEEGLPAPRRSEGDAEGRTVAEPHAVHGAVQQLEI